jgi:uncharacterized protein (TIGR00297 family)
LEHLAVSTPELTVACIAALLVALVALRRQLLSSGGAVASATVGPALVAVGGWWLGTLLIVFFLTSSLLPSAERKAPARTARQVLANGGPALTLGLLAVLVGEHAFLVGAGAAIAAATADTWATELGKTFGGTPLSIRTGARVPAGTSGAVSGIGTVASIAGAILIAVMAVLLAPLAPDAQSIHAGQAAIIAGCGVLGSAIDTLIGGTLQAWFQCPRCGKRTEHAGAHRPGHPVHHTGGIRWITNGTVNLIAASSAGFIATVLAMLVT